MPSGQRKEKVAKAFWIVKELLDLKCWASPETPIFFVGKAMYPLAMKHG